MRKIIVTGANGVGKTHFASELSSVRPNVPVVSLDALKLSTNWKRRPRTEVLAALESALEKDAWILEGGPSLLLAAIDKADALVWLDPPELLRAWRLAKRPWFSFARTRPELPAGNVDWPWQQYVFGLRSLRKGAQFRSYVAGVFSTASELRKWHCRNQDDRQVVLRHWAESEEL